MAKFNVVVERVEYTALFQTFEAATAEEAEALAQLSASRLRHTRPATGSSASRQLAGSRNRSICFGVILTEGNEREERTR